MDDNFLALGRILKTFNSSSKFINGVHLLLKHVINVTNPDQFPIVRIKNKTVEHDCLVLI